MTEDYDQLFAVYFGDIYRHWRHAIDQSLSDIQPALSKTEWHIIGKLHCRGPKMTQLELAEYMFMDAGQLTRALRGLEDKGIVCKTIDANDRRVRHLALVDPDADYIQKMIAVNLKMHEAICSVLLKKDQKQLKQYLENIREVIKTI